MDVSCVNISFQWSQETRIRFSTYLVKAFVHARFMTIIYPATTPGLTTNQGKYTFSPTIFTLHFTTLLATTDF